MQLPKKAIIAAAGTGTRFLPATKVMPKEMLPMIDKPIVQYSVEEAVAAGIEQVILVSRQGVRAVREHFQPRRRLEKQLAQSNKLDKLKLVRSIDRLAKFSFIEQSLKLPYGSATPLLAAIKLLGDEPFLYLFGDDLTIAKTSVCRQLIEVYKNNPEVGAVIAVQKMPREVLYRYGVVKFKAGSQSEYETIVEKPILGEEPSNMVSFGRYLFSPKILPIIKKLEIGKDNELWLVDAINKLAQTMKVLVYEIDGQWLTTGDALNYLKATVEFVWQRQDLAEGFKNYVAAKLKK